MRGKAFCSCVYGVISHGRVVEYYCYFLDSLISMLRYSIWSVYCMGHTPNEAKVEG